MPYIPFFSKKPNTIKSRKKDMPDGLWMKCPSCEEIIFKREIELEFNVCPQCSHHFRLGRKERIDLLLDKGSFEEWDETMSSIDVIKFTGLDSYTSKLESNMRKTGYKDAVTCGKGRMGTHDVAFGVMDFDFLGASMGSVVGEKITRMIERGTAAGMPVILVCASGGARMYEGLMSLMQMAKTSAALARHAQAKLPYIPILTNPTTAGVMASFATLGDVIIAEPKALIGFAGRRVIKETTQQDLPDDFQRSEFLQEHGLIDRIIHRHELKNEVIKLLDFFQPEMVPAEEPEDTPAFDEQVATAEHSDYIDVPVIDKNDD